MVRLVQPERPEEVGGGTGRPLQVMAAGGISKPGSQHFSSFVPRLSTARDPLQMQHYGSRDTPATCCQQTTKRNETEGHPWPAGAQEPPQRRGSNAKSIVHSPTWGPSTQPPSWDPVHRAGPVGQRPRGCHLFAAQSGVTSTDCRTPSLSFPSVKRAPGPQRRAGAAEREPRAPQALT